MPADAVRQPRGDVIIQMPVGDLFQLQVAEDLLKVLQPIALRVLCILGSAQFAKLNPPLLCTIQTPVAHFTRECPSLDVGQEIIAEGSRFLSISGAAMLFAPCAVAIFIAERIEGPAPVKTVFTSTSCHVFAFLSLAYTKVADV